MKSCRVCISKWLCLNRSGMQKWQLDSLTYSDYRRWLEVSLSLLLRRTLAPTSLESAVKKHRNKETICFSWSTLCSRSTTTPIKKDIQPWIKNNTWLFSTPLSIGLCNVWRIRPTVMFLRMFGLFTRPMRSMRFSWSRLFATSPPISYQWLLVWFKAQSRVTLSTDLTISSYSLRSLV